MNIIKNLLLVLFTFNAISLNAADNQKEKNWIVVRQLANLFMAILPNI